MQGVLKTNKLSRIQTTFRAEYVNELSPRFLSDGSSADV